MADIRKLYLELIHDYAPYEDMTEHESMTECEMLYNLIEIRENNDIDIIDNEDDQIIYDRFNTLIDLFKALGYNAYTNYQD